jgi:hypothetical protein
MSSIRRVEERTDGAAAGEQKDVRIEVRADDGVGRGLGAHPVEHPLIGLPVVGPLRSGTG